MERSELAVLGFLAEPDEWKLDADGDWLLPEDGEDPGWLIWVSGDRLTLDWGCLSFEADIQGDLARAATRLMRAALAWGDDPEESDHV